MWEIPQNDSFDALAKQLKGQNNAAAKLVADISFVIYRFYNDGDKYSADPYKYVRDKVDFIGDAFAKVGFSAGVELIKLLKKSKSDKRYAEALEALVYYVGDLMDEEMLDELASMPM